MPTPVENDLSNASVALQKLDKRLRLLHNRGEADAAEVALCKEAIGLLRRVAAIRGLRITDIDSRGERRKD